ncbi:pseudoazurin [Tateyamaria sp. syn59]|uniref:pseudoazurin n=1 Tax=Tateyamaria sp. syn59 TaxID=2576942 RepID=UPI0011BF4840|nr:pseudoazurin [Tateyamaria sp. syn59]
MSNSHSRRTFLAGSAAATLVPALPTKVFAQEPVTIEMLTKHPTDSRLRNIFLPRVISVEAGQTVLFKATDRSHNSASIDGMIPEAAEEWDGRINEDIEVIFDVPGIYGYKCTPHAATGMVALVVVEGEGKLDNLEAAQSVRQRGRAKKVFEEIWEEASEMGLLEPSSA